MLTLVPHGLCLSSSPEIIALIVVSNPGIALAPFAMPAIRWRLANWFPHHG